jgi:hypothetical protein
VTGLAEDVGGGFTHTWISNSCPGRTFRVERVSSVGPSEYTLLVDTVKFSDMRDRMSVADGNYTQQHALVGSETKSLEARVTAVLHNAAPNTSVDPMNSQLPHFASCITTSECGDCDDEEQEAEEERSYSWQDVDGLNLVQREETEEIGNAGNVSKPPDVSADRLENASLAQNGAGDSTDESSSEQGQAAAVSPPLALPELEPAPAAPESLDPPLRDAAKLRWAAETITNPTHRKAALAMAAALEKKSQSRTTQQIRLVYLHVRTCCRSRCIEPCCLYSSWNRPQLGWVRGPAEGRGDRTVGFDAQDENDEVEVEDDEAEEEKDDDDDVESYYSDQGNEGSFIAQHSVMETPPQSKATRPALDPERLAALAHADLPSELYAQLSEILAWHKGVHQARRFERFLVL